MRVAATQVATLAGAVDLDVGDAEALEFESERDGTFANHDRAITRRGPR
jgi:hypothetical protein